ncbi:hypothetical protein, partial [Pantoea sp.]
PDELPGCSTPRPWKRTILSVRFDATPFGIKTQFICRLPKYSADGLFIVQMRPTSKPMDVILSVPLLSSLCEH